jgi:hypothetical protein
MAPMSCSAPATHPSDTHDVLVVAPSGCGKTALILRIILFFWNAFNHITLLCQQMDPPQEPPPEDDDWLLLKQLPREKKNRLCLNPFFAACGERTIIMEDCKSVPKESLG